MLSKSPLNEVLSADITLKFNFIHFQHMFGITTKSESATQLSFKLNKIF